MIDGNARYSPWVTPAAVAAHGALAVWDPDGGGAGTPYWAQDLGKIGALETVTLSYGGQPIRARFAIVLPSSGRKP